MMSIVGTPSSIHRKVVIDNRGVTDTKLGPESEFVRGSEQLRHQFGRRIIGNPNRKIAIAHHVEQDPPPGKFTLHLVPENRSPIFPSSRRDRRTG